MFGHREMNMDDYLSILRRRKWWIAIPAVIGPLLGYGISLMLPEQYMSQTTVLVEQQRVPWVQSVVSDSLNQRLSTMRDQILSRAQLQPLIEKYNLYKGENVPMEDLIDKMRKNIAVKNITTTPGAGPIGVSGFSIGFTADDPHTAQQITGQILSMFIEQNVKLRETRAQDTTNFFISQLEEAKRKLDEQDQKMANFKRQYLGQLPGQEATLLGLLTSTSNQYDAANQALNRAVSDKQFAETMLANQLQAWKASQQSGVNPVTMDAQLTFLENQLLDLQARYTTGHPDVQKLKTQIEQLKAKVAETGKDTTPVRPTPLSSVEPPQIAQIRAQIRQFDLTIAEKTRDQERLRAQVQTYQSRLQLSPLLEQQYKEVTRDYQTALDFYNDLLQKKTQSEMSKNLEKSQQGEQFKVMDAPNLSERPAFPDRRLFAGGGLAAGLALGLVLAVLLEMRDKSLRTELDVEFCLQLPALVCLPSVDLLESGAPRKMLHSGTEG